VRLERLRKRFGRQTVVDIEALDIHDGEFFSLLGPSGCGKTTTLRLIAGLTDPDEGRVLIGGRDATPIPTARRNLGMVFQRYALFPHLTVGENVGYGLRERGVDAATAGGRVREALALVAMPDCADRYPHQLSGGQQQRVAMARAVVYRPDVLLLDEPLSSLDARLRVAMRAELKQLQRSIGVTTVFVTHDQQEALALSDRIGVMRDGRMEQVGPPLEIYDAPQTVFVAGFVGGTNVLPGEASGTSIAVKPERVRLVASAVASGFSRTPDTVESGFSRTPASLTGLVESIAYLGAAWSYGVRAGDHRIEARTSEPVLLDGRPVIVGDHVAVTWDRESARTLDREPGALRRGSGLAGSPSTGLGAGREPAS
jgi:ABC-type Fe3+/spermidine/putrescine transport system ATPase subunit